MVGLVVVLRDLDFLSAGNLSECLRAQSCLAGWGGRKGSRDGGGV